MLHAPPNWYKTFFTGLAVEMWLQAIPAEATLQEADFLRAKLQVAPGAKVLDVPCGGGRHAIALAETGYAVTAVDISPDFLQAARAKSDQDIRWEQRDMLDLLWADEFDGTYCFGNSFAYLADLDNGRFLKAIARALKPGARFILDYPAVAEVVLSIFQLQSSHQFGDIAYRRDGQYDPATGRIVVQHSFRRGDQAEQHVMSQRIYTCREVCEMLAEAGFADLECFGGLQDEPFQLGAKRFLVIATKSGRATANP